jgi:hypothetical protein
MMGATLPLLDALGVPQTQKCRVPAAISSVVNFSVTDPTNNYAPYNIVTGAPFGRHRSSCWESGVRLRRGKASLRHRLAIAATTLN